MSHFWIAAHLFIFLCQAMPRTSTLCCPWHLSLSIHHALSPPIPNHLVVKKRTSIMDAAPACNPAVGVRTEMDRKIRQADGQDSLRELDGMLEAHQGNIRTGALPPGVHRMWIHPGDAHLLGPLARVPQLPDTQQHRELEWLVQSARRKREGDRISQEPRVARKSLGGVSGELHAQEGPTKANEALGQEQGPS